MTCDVCGQPIEGVAHYPHETDCDPWDWCNCEAPPVHPSCCPDCVRVLPGQLDLGVTG